MKLTFLINYDVAATLALNYLLPALDEHEISIFYTRKPAQPVSPELAALAAYEEQSLFHPPPGVHSLQSLATQTDSRLSQLNNVNSAEGLHTMAASQSEMIVSIRHMSILRDPVIQLPRHGVINLHSGLLPAYQGVMASFWAMLHRQPVIGTTLHYIQDASIDTGDIVKTSEIPARYDKSYLWNVLNLYRGGAAHVLEAIALIAAGESLPASPQQGSSAYYSYPTEEDVRQFFTQGGTLFNEHDVAEFAINGQA